MGTVTEIYDYFRLLFARVGTPHCYKCGEEISQQTAVRIVDSILTEEEDAKIQILAPIAKGRAGREKHHKIFEDLGKEGFIRVLYDGEISNLDNDFGTGQKP